MMFLNSLTDWFRKRIPTEKTPQRPSTRLRLETLEDRVVPAPFSTATYTQASVQINPGFTVTETVSAQVTPFVGFSFVGGQFVPVAIPSGATNPTGGTILFNLNNMQQSASLNSTGQASATFQVPILAFLAGQTLSVHYDGFTDASGNFWGGSDFLAPLYKNFDNLLLTSTLTFAQLTPQQHYAAFISEDISGAPNFTQTTLNPYNTANGMTDTLGGGLVAFNYIDPGLINSVTAFGIQFPASVAFQLGAYKGLQ